MATRTYTVYRVSDDKVMDVLQDVNDVYTQDELFKFRLAQPNGYSRNYASAMYPIKSYYIRVDDDL